MVGAFEAWLFARMRGAGDGPVPVNEPPYLFTPEEAQFVERYRFYFTYPVVAAEADVLPLEHTLLAWTLVQRHGAPQRAAA